MYIGRELKESQINELVVSVLEESTVLADKFLGDYTLKPYLTFDDVTIEPRPLITVESRNDLTPYVPDYEKLMHIHHLPILGASMEFMRAKFAINLYKSGGLHILPRVGLTQEERLDMLKEVVDAGAQAGIAIGLKDDEEFIRKIFKVDRRVPVISVDVAHGASKAVFEYVIREVLPVLMDTKHRAKLIIGNVGSLSGYIAIDLLARVLGAPNLIFAKVGVGPGAACTTRVNTGVGVGQFSLLHTIKMYTNTFTDTGLDEQQDVIDNIEASIEKIVSRLVSVDSAASLNKFARLLSTGRRSAAQYRGVRFISDGGVEKPGDFVKAIAAGASYVMMGKFFVNPDFDGEFIEKDGKKQFIYYGMASKKAKNGKDEYVEGAVLSVPVRWKSTDEAVRALEYGLRSAMAYSDAPNLDSFKNVVRIVGNSIAAIYEGRPRGDIITL